MDFCTGQPPILKLPGTSCIRKQDLRVPAISAEKSSKSHGFLRWTAADPEYFCTGEAKNLFCPEELKILSSVFPGMFCGDKVKILKLPEIIAWRDQRGDFGHQLLMVVTPETTQHAHMHTWRAQKEKTITVSKSEIDVHATLAGIRQRNLMR